mmetsp:Transcript_3517/g.11737  ORF Transcript_3517/g.11737 Transcript_3517/m.11737 type:complete len:384 (-) Transcript_3517:603-1754(-)
MRAWMEGLCRWPMLDVVCRGSCPSMMSCGLMDRKASMTTLPFTDWIGSITTATARWLSASNDCCVLMSTPDSQQPKPGWEWYQPTTISGRPVCLSMSSILVWNTGSTASTLTPVPVCGIAKTSMHLTVYSSTNSPSMRPITSMGTPARPCLSILRSAMEEMYTISAVSTTGASGGGAPPPWACAWRTTTCSSPAPRAPSRPWCAPGTAASSPRPTRLTNGSSSRARPRRSSWRDPRAWCGATSAGACTRWWAPTWPSTARSSPTSACRRPPRSTPASGSSSALPSPRWGARTGAGWPLAWPRSRRRRLCSCTPCAPRRPRAWWPPWPCASRRSPTSSPLRPRACVGLRATRAACPAGSARRPGTTSSPTCASSRRPSSPCARR